MPLFTQIFFPALPPFGILLVIMWVLLTGDPQVSEDLFLHLHSFLSVLYTDRSASLLILLCSLSSDVELLVNFSFQLVNVSTPEFLLCSLL